MTVGTILLIVVLIILLGGVGYGANAGWSGPYLGGGIGLILLILIILLLVGRI